MRVVWIDCCDVTWEAEAALNLFFFWSTFGVEAKGVKGS